MNAAPVAVDVAVAGAGPAGAAIARRLAVRGRRVLLLEGSRFEAPRVGESLGPGVYPLLAELGALDAVRATEPVHSYGVASSWGDAEVRAHSFVFSPYGRGWHVDRRRADRALAGAAAEVGAELQLGVRVSRLLPVRGEWRIELAGSAAPPIHARSVIDATGRGAVLGRSLGGRRRLVDHLVGVAAHFDDGAAAAEGHALIEAVRDGWWYSAPLPGGGLVVVRHTDADLLAQSGGASPAGWSRALGETRHTALRCAGRRRVWGPRVHPAVSHLLTGHGPAPPWLAVGDALAAVDPLSGSGVERALTSAAAGAEAIDRWLDGDPRPAEHYRAEAARAFARYLEERTEYYALERRWSGDPFWRRRAMVPPGF